MTRFISTRYPHLRVAALGVRFKDGVAEVADPAVAVRLAQSRTKGVGLADGERLPEPESEQDDGVPKRPAKAATVEAWREYVLATFDVDASEVADMTKAQLQELTEVTE